MNDCFEGLFKCCCIFFWSANLNFTSVAVFYIWLCDFLYNIHKTVCAQTIWMLSGKVVLSIDFHMNRVSLGQMLAEVTLVLLKFEGICSSVFWWNLFSSIFHFGYMKILSYSFRADWFIFTSFSSSFCLLAMNFFKLWNINKTNWLNVWRKIRSVIEDSL